MTREIKFRAWIPERNMFFKGPIAWLVKQFNELKTSFEQANIQQFTGLKDKNGVEIYEGDIIKSIHEEITIRYKIVWDEEQAGFMYEEKEWSKHQHSWPMTCDIAFLSEVIGNIYQNPALLS